MLISPLSTACPPSDSMNNCAAIAPTRSPLRKRQRTAALQNALAGNSAPSIDVSQTTYPDQWRSVLIYRWDTATPFPFEERIRGMG